MELDYLAPFLAQIGDPDKIARGQAFRLKEDCLADLKHRLIDKANLIQARFEKVRHQVSHLSCSNTAGIEIQKTLLSVLNITLKMDVFFSYTLKC